MHLSLSHQWSSWTVLLLLVSNLLLWENTASAMRAKLLNVHNYTSYGDTWNQAIKISQDMNQYISDLSTHVLEVLLGLSHSLLQAWLNPLHHLWAEMCDRLGSTPPNLYKALMLKESNIKLLDAIKNIAKKGNFEINEKANYTAWSELGFLQSPNRDTRYFAFYNLFHCLKKDSNNVEMYLKLLKCRLIRSKC